MWAMSVWIAKLLGPVLFVTAIPMLAFTRDLQEVAREFLKNRALIYVTGVLVMIGGLAIVNSHNIWIADWPVIITLFGWAMIIGGAARVALPTVVRTLGGAMVDRSTMIRVSGAVSALIGVYLTYKGYF
jgi:hypothetical protein